MAGLECFKQQLLPLCSLGPHIFYLNFFWLWLLELRFYYTVCPLPLTQQRSLLFRCAEGLLNQIWECASYKGLVPFCLLLSAETNLLFWWSLIWLWIHKPALLQLLAVVSHIQRVQLSVHLLAWLSPLFRRGKSFVVLLANVRVHHLFLTVVADDLIQIEKNRVLFFLVKLTKHQLVTLVSWGLVFITLELQEDCLRFLRLGLLKNLIKGRDLYWLIVANDLESLWQELLNSVIDQALVYFLVWKAILKL